jgi:hypothetical protein
MIRSVSAFVSGWHLMPAAGVPCAGVRVESEAVVRACRVAVVECAQAACGVDGGWLARACAGAMACVDRMVLRRAASTMVVRCLTRCAGSGARLVTLVPQVNPGSHRDAGSWTTARGWNERRD